MSPVLRFELILLLMSVVVALELLARRLRLPPAAAFILGGVALALVPGLPNLQLDPGLVLVLFVPPLLQAGAFFTVWRDFRADLRIILQLAVGAVLFTTLAVGVTAHWIVPGLPWAACFALGAIVSPPDAVSAKAVLHGLRLPQRMLVLLEGESLVNDATGLVLYRFAVAAVLTGAFSVGGAVLSFGVLAAGGVIAGIVFGLAASSLMGRLSEASLSIVASFLAAWVSYIAGEALGVSGVLSTVTCGLVMGWRQHTALSATVRTQARAVWDVIVFVLESLIFILIGLSLRGVLARLGGDWEAIAGPLPAISAIVGVVVLARFAWIVPLTYVTRALSPSLRRRDPYPPIGVPIVMSWAGMRGVVSLAAALALPEGFPGRDFILVATFAVILATVLVQGTTLAPLIRALHLDRYVARQSTLLSEAEARARMARAQLAAIERESLQPDGTHRHPRLVEQYSHRAHAAARFSEAGQVLAEDRAAHFGAVLAAVIAGRAESLHLYQVGAIHELVLAALERELDLEEMSARRFLEETEAALAAAA